MLAGNIGKSLFGSVLSSVGNQLSCHISSRLDRGIGSEDAHGFDQAFLTYNRFPGGYCD